jgi:hypothetical protein
VKKYLLFFAVPPKGGSTNAEHTRYESIALDVLPEGADKPIWVRAATGEQLRTFAYVKVGARRFYFWWYLQLNEDGVYSCSRRDGYRGDIVGNYQRWHRQLPDNWLDRTGSLRNAEGRLVFKK